MSFGLSHSQKAIVLLLAEKIPKSYKSLLLPEPHVQAFGKCFVFILKLSSQHPSKQVLLLPPFCK